MINPKTGDTTWYYHTDKDHLDILVKGLQCYSIGGLTAYRTPWLLLSQNPDPDRITFCVDLEGIKNTDWSFTEDRFEDKLLRVYQDISAERIRPYVPKEI